MNKKWIPALLLTFSVTAHAELMAFGVIGDYGDDSEHEKQVAALIDKQHPEFIITMGDNNYRDGCWDTIDKNIGKYYSNYIGNYKGEYGRGAKENRFFPSLGNHDWNAYGKCMYKGELPYLSYFTLPGNSRYYDFKKGSIHFFALDSDGHEPDGNKIDSKQYAWLKENLKQSDACFKVVYFHHAAYSSGAHGSNKAMQWKYEKLGADVVLSGHDHHYERIVHDGMTYIVNGVGGAELRKIKEKIHGSQFDYAEMNGYMMGVVDENRLSFAFYNLKNEVKDRFAITKNCK
jgi:predicted phosphodiesterase